MSIQFYDVITTASNYFNYDITLVDTITLKNLRSTAIKAVIRSQHEHRTDYEPNHLCSLIRIGLDQQLRDSWDTLEEEERELNPVHTF